MINCLINCLTSRQIYIHTYIVYGVGMYVVKEL